MRSTSLGNVWGLATMCLVAIAGCGTSTTGKPSDKTAAGVGSNSEQMTVTAPAGMHSHDGEDHSPGTELSAEDQALADMQKECPVSGEELGGMGPPIKLVVKGEPVFICCKGCEKKVNADPDKYLAKVAELKKANVN